MRRLFLLSAFLLTCAVPKPVPTEVVEPVKETPAVDAGSCCPYTNHYDCVDTAGEYSVDCPTREP